MTTDAVVDVTDRADDIDTSEAYSTSAFLSQRKILIPYINLVLHGKDATGRRHDPIFIERCYLILTDVREISWIGRDQKEIETIGTRKIHADGTGASIKWITLGMQGWGGFELKALFDKLRIFIPADAGMGSQHWTPYSTPVFPQNIPDDRVASFFALEQLPEQLAQLVGGVGAGLERLEMVQGSRTERLRVRRKWIEPYGKPSEGMLDRIRRLLST